MVWYLIAAVVTYFAYRNLSKRRIKVTNNYPDVFRKKSVALSDTEVVALNSYKSETRQFLLIALVSFGLAFWWGSYQPMQVRKDLELQSQVYEGKVLEGWLFQCQDMFQNFIGDGTYLYANGNRYDSDWCDSLMTNAILSSIFENKELFEPSEYSDSESAGEKGFNIGARFAREAVFSRVPYLCYGDDCITKMSVEDYYIDANRDSFYP